MKDRNSPRGKVFAFKLMPEWRDGITQHLQLSAKYRSHMVIVLGKAPERASGWVKIVTITSTVPSDPNQYHHYLPINPTKKFQKGGIQLKLCRTFGGQTILRLLSYVRIDNVEEVPLEILSEVVRSDGLDVMLQEKWFGTLLNCVGK